jgi:DNA invertase Pin-like site-specific DNA recombinase
MVLTVTKPVSKRGIGLVILSMGGERPDTRNPTSKLMLTILAGVATWEREIMLERQREGIAKAKAAGKYKGRPISIDAAQIRQLRAELGPLQSRSVSASPGVRSTALSHSVVAVRWREPLRIRPCRCAPEGSRRCPPLV